MWYNAENNAIRKDKQSKKNKAQNIPVLSRSLVSIYSLITKRFQVSPTRKDTDVDSNEIRAPNYFFARPDILLIKRQKRLLRI